MILRCFRVDRIYRALTDYITATMGEEYITPPVIRYTFNKLIMIKLSDFADGKMCF